MLGLLFSIVKNVINVSMVTSLFQGVLSVSLSYSLSLSLSLSISLYHRSSDTKKNKDIWWTDGNIHNEYNEYDDQDKVKFAEDMNHISER